MAASSAIAELLRRPDVVGQDEDLLGEERPGERVVVVAGLRRQEAPSGSWPVAPFVRRSSDPLDDDARLAGAGTSDDDERPLVPLDDAALGSWSGHLWLSRSSIVSVRQRGNTSRRLAAEPQTNANSDEALDRLLLRVAVGAVGPPRKPSRLPSASSTKRDSGDLVTPWVSRWLGNARPIGEAFVSGPIARRIFVLGRARVTGELSRPRLMITE